MYDGMRIIICNFNFLPIRFSKTKSVRHFFEGAHFVVCNIVVWKHWFWGIIVTVRKLKLFSF